MHEFRVTIYCTSCDCNANCKFLVLYQLFISVTILYKIKYSSQAVPEQCISWINAPTLNYNQLLLDVQSLSKFVWSLPYKVQYS